MIAKAGKTFTASGNIVVKMPRYIKPLIPDYPSGWHTSTGTTRTGTGTMVTGNEPWRDEGEPYQSEIAHSPSTQGALAETWSGGGGCLL